jgi:hypothetical protein
LPSAKAGVLAVGGWVRASRFTPRLAVEVGLGMMPVCGSRMSPSTPVERPVAGSTEKPFRRMPSTVTM